MTTTPMVLTLDSLQALPPVLNLEEAARLLDIGRTSAYTLAKNGAFPAPVLRIGKLYRVPTAGLLEVLGVHALSPDPVDFRPGHGPSACADATSRASIQPTC
ncbi:putative DNA-binding transcriptional regulator AlpA [Catenulispora sp. GAS73]|uniref:helix-turn-helix transcriptional regulator n=1 Tax=Catenulispora sp. GAS73 TaxID=3156269 RepID=UPI003517B99C